MPWTIGAERAAGAGADDHAVGQERAAGNRAQVVAVMVVDQLARLAGADGQHVAVVAGDAGHGADRLELAVAELHAVLDPQRGGVEVVQVDAQVELLFQDGLGGGADPGTTDKITWIIKIGDKVTLILIGDRNQGSGLRVRLYDKAGKLVYTTAAE